MSTWLDNIKDPVLRAAWRTVGNQDRTCLHNMVRALKLMPWLNTPADNTRLAAAEYILKRGSR